MISRDYRGRKETVKKKEIRALSSADYELFMAGVPGCPKQTAKQSFAGYRMSSNVSDYHRLSLVIR